MRNRPLTSDQSMFFCSFLFYLIKILKISICFFSSSFQFHLDTYLSRVRTNFTMADTILFEDIFDVKDIDPDGPKFDRGTNKNPFPSGNI